MAEETNLYNYTEPVDARPELSAKPADKRPLLFGGIGAIVIIVLFGVLGYFLFIYPQATATIRDIFIIFLGLGAFVVILLLIALVVMTAYLVLKVNDLVKLIDREIKPILVKLQSSAVTVQGTTTFLSENAVKPVISTAATIAAARTF
jgi:hypothetical protein